MKPRQLRRDIQFLRGIAVLAVLVYHARLGPFANGYLGVDVFFVISGYLMTAQILRGIDAGRFRFADFYLRRARRLLPALYCTLAVTTLLGYWVLTDRQWQDYLAQLYGSLSFTANLVLPFQVGYFDDVADSRPLLHIWSLSLEEQFYFLLPLLLGLLALRPRATPLVLVLLAITSLTLYQLAHLAVFSSREWLAVSLQDWAFYLLPTRAWELLAGSLVAWAQLSGRGWSLPPLACQLGLATLVALLAWPAPWLGVPLQVLLAVLLTAGLLLGSSDRWLARVPAAEAVQRVGDWSYSVYLVHWPLLSLAFIVYLGFVPTAVTLGLLAASLMLGAAQYRWVEQRFRYPPRDGRRRRTALGLATATAALVAMTLPAQWQRHEAAAVIAANPAADPAAFRAKNFGLQRRCARGRMNWVDAHCRSGEHPPVAVWGDSYAMHLVPGLLANPVSRDGLVQLTKSGCSPILDYSGLFGKPLGAARDCLRFNLRAVEYMLASPSITHVVMGSPFGAFLPDMGRALYRGTVAEQDTALALRSLADTVQRLVNAGKTVTIVSPPPTDGRDIGECLERRMSGRPVLSSRGCEIEARLARSRAAPVDAALRTVAADTGARVIWLSALLCNGRRCITERDGVPLYRDMGHLSIPGSRALLADVAF